MSRSGVVGATTRISDDVAAIGRGRRADCHQLTVLHHIRMRGQAVMSALNTYGGPGPEVASTQHKSHHQSSFTRSASTDPIHVPADHKPPDLKQPDDVESVGGMQMQGRGFQGYPEYDDQPRGDATENDSAMPSQSGFRGAPRASAAADSQRNLSNTNTHSNKETSSSDSSCRSFWCVLRDILVLFAFFGVIYLLLTSAGGSTPTDEAYDFVP